MPRIKLMSNSGDGFPERDVTASTVGALKSELGSPGNSAVSVNGITSQDNQELSDGDLVAIVNNDKTGGTLKLKVRLVR